MKSIILASTSPRRKWLLESAGIQFKIDSGSYEENMRLKLAPPRLAAHLSRGKAESVASRHKHAVIIAADTLITIDDRVLGKPHTPARATHILKLLSGRMHRVITGFTVLDADSGRRVTRSVTARVWFRKLSRREIRAYVQTGEPLDKAGAYAIQGRGISLIEKISGDYSAIVGLPLPALLQVLKRFLPAFP